MSVAYVDWSQQEFGIAAAFSKDPNMAEAYRSGDPYLAFAKQAGAVPQHATKHSHKRERALFKACTLGVQYGMGAESLAASIGETLDVARELLRLHRQTYPRFWKWSESAVDCAMVYRSLQTVFGWRLHVGSDVNPRSLANFPCQANGAEMLRLACCLMTERGLWLCAPIHDAVLVEGPTDTIEQTVAAAQSAMREASAIVLGGFELETDAEIVSYPNRYMDERGTEMWELVLGILAELDPVRFGTNQNQTGRGLAPNGTGCLSNNSSSLNVSY
jgi:DNA polymerase I-like protein with 3'-5' exonuclease and polymerase domains